MPDSRDDDPSDALVDDRAAAITADPDDELPVVARLVVEIRSDGRRTVARGAIEDVDGNRAAVRARGDSPLQLAWQLARGLLDTPRRLGRELGRRTRRTSVRGLLTNRRRRR